MNQFAIALSAVFALSIAPAFADEHKKDEHHDDHHEKTCAELHCDHGCVDATTDKDGKHHEAHCKAK